MTDPTPAFATPPQAIPYTTPVMPVRRPLNPLAIVSFATSLLALGAIAVIAGHLALVQIKRQEQSGRGFALAGVILGYVGIAIGLAVVGFWIYVLSTGNLVVSPLLPNA